MKPTLHDLMSSDLETHGIDTAETQAQDEVQALDLGYVEKVAQDLEGVIQALSGMVVEDEEPASAEATPDVRELLLSKVAEIRNGSAASAEEQNTEELREQVLQKLAHLTPQGTEESIDEMVAEEAPEQECTNIRATLDTWRKQKEAAATTDTKSAPASVKSILDLIGGGSDE